MKRILISTLILLFAFATLLAQARMDHKGQMMQREKGEKPMTNIWEQLKLTPEQQQKIKALHEANRKVANTVQAEIKNMMIDLRSAIEAENFTQAKAIQKQISDKRLQLANARLTLMEAMIKELTAEQKEAFRKMRPMMGQGGEMFGAPGSRRGGNMQRRGMRAGAGDCEDCEDDE